MLDFPALLPQNGRVIAVVAGVENYIKDRFEKVQYAEADAHEFADVLVEMYGSDNVECELIVMPDTTKTHIEYQLQQAIDECSEDDLFVFFYAGHGFFGGGDNCLTAADTAPTNIIETSISVSRHLLQPLAASDCHRALLFVDACATRVSTRAPISPFDDGALHLPPGTGDQYQAAFLSCQRGQSSYPASALRHGIWTHHLLAALRGEAPGAIDTENFVTDVSLRNYLRKAVPQYIREHTQITGKQVPEAIIRASSTFAIRSIPANATSVAEDDMSILAAPTRDAYFEGVREGNVRQLPKFLKGHMVPERHSTATQIFVKRAAWPIVRDEVNELYDDAKEVFDLRREEIHRDKSEPDASGSLDCEHFRYSIEAEQHPADPKEYRIVRQLTLRDTSDATVNGCHRIFGSRLDKLVIDVDSRDWDYDDLVSRFEDIKASLGGSLHEDEDEQLITYVASDGVQLEVDVGKGLINLSTPDGTIPGLLARAREIRFGLTGENPLRLR